MNLAPFLVMAALVPVAFTQPSGVLTAGERQMLLDHLRDSRRDLLASVAAINGEQWSFRPTPGEWSISDCFELAVAAEDYFQESARRALAAPPAPRHIAVTFPQDDRLLQAVTRPGAGTEFPVRVRITGHWPSREQAAAEFERRRDRSMAYAAATQDPLRTHLAEVARLGTVDAFQTLLLMSAHTARCAARIERIKAAAAFPRRGPVTPAN